MLGMKALPYLSIIKWLTKQHYYCQKQKVVMFAIGHSLFQGVGNDTWTLAEV